MNKEFKKITNKNETRYVLETMTAGATGAGSIASAPVSLGKLRKRLQELKDKISVPTTKPRNPTGMGSTPGRGTQVHKDKKHDQKMGKEKHKKPFYEQMMDEIEQISELEKPSGSMFLKFRGKRLPGDEMMVLGYGGFGTTPKDVTTGNALIKPFPADESYDVINKIEKIFKDQDFVGIEKIILDIPNALTGQLRDVLDYAEQDPERFELYTGDDGEEPEAKTGGKVIGIGPDGKRIDRTPPKAQVGGSSRGVKQSKPDVTLSPKTPQAQTLLKQSGLPRTGSGYKAPHALLQKLQSSLGQSKFDSMFNVGGMAEGDQPDHEISMASSELQSIAADAANLLDIVKQRSEEEGLEAWQQSKITKAADYMNSVLQSIRGDEEQGVAEGSGPQLGDEVYYGTRLVGTFKGYSKLGKIITEPNVDEMGDEYLNKDAYWDPKDITIKSKQGVAEGGILKSIKRGLQGWDKNAVGPGGEKLGDPRDIVKRAKAMDTDTAKKVRAGLGSASDHSPAGLQKRVLDRKLKGVEEGSEDPSYKKGWELCNKDPSADPQHLFRRHGEGLDHNQFIKGFNDNAKSRGMSIYGDVSGDVDYSTLRYKEFKRDRGAAEGYGELDNLKAKFEERVASIIARAKAEGRPLTDREKKAIAILKGKDQGVAEVSSSFQGKLDREKADFKRRELDAELGDEGKPNQNYRSASPPPKGMYFYNVSPGQERLAQMAGLKQTKSGKWYSKYPNPEAGGKFGPGKYWEPKSEGVAEGPEENKKWRDQARDASKEKRPWSPTNLPNYKKSKEQGVAEVSGSEEITPKAASYILSKMEQGVPTSAIIDKFPALYRMMEIIAGEQGLHMDDDIEDIEASLYHDLEDIAQQGNRDEMSEGLRDPKDNPCWKGYKPVGTKKKGGKTVPNCVPTNEDAYINQLMTALESKK